MAYFYKGIWRYLFWITLALAIFASVLTFERVYSFSFFILLVLAVYFKNYQFVSKIKFLSKSKFRLVMLILLIMVLAILVGGIVSRTQYNLPLDFESVWSTAKRFLVSRVLFDPSYMANIYFDEFSHTSTFLYGKSIRLLSLFGVEFHHTVSPSFVAELWLNFGWYGVILGSMMIGFILQLIQLGAFRKKSIPSLSLFIILLLNGPWIIYGHLLATMVVSVYLLSLLFLYFLSANSLARIRKKPQISI